MKVLRGMLIVAGMWLVAQSAVRAENEYTFIQLALVPPQLQLVDEKMDIKGLRLEIYGRNANVSALDIGILNETTGKFGGLGFGLANFANEDSGGIQFAGIFNEGKKGFSGAQVGLVNHAGKMKGVQLGLVNIADDMSGIQIGLWNQINSKDLWYILPIVNWKF